MNNRLRLRESGLSLVELMVAMTLGIFLVGAVASLFVASKRSYTETERFARLGENGRFALQRLSDDLRLAGFFGEVPATEIRRDDGLGAISGDCSSPGGALDTGNYIAVVRASNAGTALGCITDAVPGTDVIVVKSARPFPLSDGDRDDETDDDGSIDTPAAPDGEHLYILSNTVTGLLFEGGDTLDSNEVPPGATAWEYRTQIFYARAALVPQLSRKVVRWDGTGFAVATEDLLEGVEWLKVMVGQDSDDDGVADGFTPSTGTIDWSRAPALQLYVLLRSPDIEAGYTDTRRYALGDQTLAPGGGFRRIVVQGSVALRNALATLRGNS